jgi:hypothetical protein
MMDPFKVIEDYGIGLFSETRPDILFTLPPIREALGAVLQSLYPGRRNYGLILQAVN